MGARPQDDKADNELGQGFHKGTGHTKSNDSAVYSTSRRCEKERYPSHFTRMVETVRVIRDFPRGRDSAVTIAGRRRQPRRAALHVQPDGQAEPTCPQIGMDPAEGHTR